MKKDDLNIIMAFTSHNRALYIYERLLKRGIETKLISAPYVTTTSCTQAVKFKEADIEVVQTELKRNNIFPTGVYKVISDIKGETYEKLQ